MAEKGLWNLAKEKIMKERWELLDEEGDAVREAMHEENFWSNWIREDERGTMPPEIISNDFGAFWN